MICHTQRFYASSIEVKRRITDGLLTPRHFHVEFEYLRRENTNWQGRRRSWSGQYSVAPWRTRYRSRDLAVPGRA